jgi:hypothetical protein
MGPTGQPHLEADRWGPQSGWEKKKKKTTRFGSGPKGAGSARSAQQARLGFVG